MSEKLQEENKQLKEELEKSENLFLLCNVRREQLLEKLEKIDKLHLKYYRAEIDIDAFHTQLRAILKEKS